jgi:hypothetical protein
MLRDAALYRTVLAVAGDAARPTAVRLSVLGLLARYYDPQWETTPEWLTTARVGDEVPHSMHYHPAPRPDASIVSEFPELVTRLAWNDPDPVVRGAALRLRAWLAMSDPDHTPVKAGSVSLVVECGTQVRLESTSDVTLRLTMRVLGTRFQTTFLFAGLRDRIVPPPANGRVRGRLYSLPPGIVVVIANGHEVARVPDTDRHKPCAPGIAPQ